MPLQNRVTPAGEIVSLPGRGTMMGNRGVLHDERRRIVRHSQLKRWIVCVTSFNSRRFVIMAPKRWTQLFFLDEATALAAGHRPCAECRYVHYKRFRRLWELEFGKVATVDEIDAVLHAERLEGKRKRTWQTDVATLPEGAFVLVNGVPHILYDGDLVRWTDGGYTEKFPRSAVMIVEVLTPPSTIAIMRAGYRPQIHITLA